MKKQLILILLWPIIAAALSLLIKANYFVSTLLFFGVPSVYLSIINKKYVKKLAIFSLGLGVLFTIVADYIAVVSGGWFIPHSIFDPLRLFGLLPLEDYLWISLYFYLITMFYETFLEEKCTPQLYHPALKYLVMIIIAMVGLFAIFYLFQPDILKMSYAYIKIGIVFVLLPIILVLCKFPKLYGKFFKAGAYFFFLTFLYEITALQLGQWTFPGENQFIGYINILGISFPFEEFFFWIMLGAMAILSYYEFFDDDRK